MRKVGGLIVTGVIVGMAATGCGSSSSSGSDPYGGTPDFASIQQNFKAPSGTFAGHEAATFSGYAAQQNNSSALSGFSLGGATSAQSYVDYRLHSLGLQPTSGPACNIVASGGGDTGSCNCPGGGSLQYDISGLKQYAEVESKGGNVDATIKISANACKSADGTESVDGKIFENFRGTVPAPGTAQDPTKTDFSIIFDAHVTSVTADKGSVHVDLDFELTTLNGVYSEYFLVKVDDGTVVVSGTWDATTKTGSITITDKNGTWTCTGDGKVATCSGTGGTKTVTL